MESHQQIEDEAARWLVRRDAAGWSAGDQAELSRWLETSTARMVAFLRLEAAWRCTDRLKSLGAGIAPGVVPSPDGWQLAPTFDVEPDCDEPAAPTQPARPRRFVMLGLAASVCAAALLGVAAYEGYFQSAPTFRTPIGGVASMPVADGSRITLNTDSEVRVALTRGERRVRLDQGEAFFEVAKDANRPFIVSAGGHRVVAVGTAFSVRCDPGGSVRVAVTEGSVRIETEAASGPQASAPQFASAGHIAVVRADHVELQRKTVSEVDEILSWRTGYLVFREVPLPDAVAEFNRYNTRKIRVTDPQLGEIKLSGKFQVIQYEAFIRLLEEGFAIRAENYDDRVELIAR